MWNSSRQVGQTTWSSNEQKLLLARYGSWPSGGLEGWAGACRAGMWSWTGPGKTEQSHAEAKAGAEGTCRGTPVLLLEAAICPWATGTVSLVSPWRGINWRLCSPCPGPNSWNKAWTRQWMAESSHMTRERSHTLAFQKKSRKHRYLRETLPVRASPRLGCSVEGGKRILGPSGAGASLTPSPSPAARRVPISAACPHPFLYISRGPTTTFSPCPLAAVLPSPYQVSPPQNLPAILLLDVIIQA